MFLTEDDVSDTSLLNMDEVLRDIPSRIQAPQKDNLMSSETAGRYFLESWLLGGTLWPCLEDDCGNASSW